ncbi:MAG: hypothetical protein C3L25_03180 [Candidatus Sedimenticola endophacoides]|uniref:Zinc transporter ZntB n=1 Tax=Candidatus Sedimenticola endophacoides TaxID=2548426 RepID=A0A6N4E0W1_9GAMM|nr:MAG: hypothetical protein C3L26_03205 [Candidatus Sedimenticola endophacoides]PUE04744.1 MAG: hypothetical protein C3L25_03180 [Candidatus Sedimenticola endophacoides]PUE05630.1 MAG: hypothetical protein C3L24_00765 [Candidatus Sedimenticola endophacoides]
MVSVRIWSDGRRVVSCRKRFLVSETDIVRAFQRGRGTRGPGDYITLMAEKMVSHMGEVIESLEDASDGLSERLLSGDTLTLRSELAEVKRAIIRLRRYLAPQREALSGVSESELEWLNDMHRARLREIADHTLRFLEDLDAARERASVTQEELLHHLSEQAERRMFLLAVITTVFLPLSFVTGLLGINVGGIPGADEPVAFLIVTLLLVVLAAGVLGVLWWRRWF